jgi:hypothetical protein
MGKNRGDVVPLRVRAEPDRFLEVMMAVLVVMVEIEDLHPAPFVVILKMQQTAISVPLA